MSNPYKIDWNEYAALARQAVAEGLHGPDIYFFYRPVLPNKVNRIGYAAHKRSGRYFLQRAQKVIASAHDKDAARAYFYGLLCHFTTKIFVHVIFLQKLNCAA